MGLLILLKTFQRLGNFYKLADVPTAVRHHIAMGCGDSSVHDWPKYDTSSTRDSPHATRSVACQGDGL